MVGPKGGPSHRGPPPKYATEWELPVGVSVEMGIMWEETWELNGKWECWYGNGMGWEFGAHCCLLLVGTLLVY